MINGIRNVIVSSESVSLRGIKTVLEIIRHSTGRERHVLAKMIQRSLTNANTLCGIEETFKAADDQTLRDLLEVRALLPLRYSALDAVMLKILKPKIYDGRLSVRQLFPPKDENDLSELLINNERVHEVEDLNDLNRRLTGNRVAFGLFHPLFEELPAVVLYVALTKTFPQSIQEILDNSSNELAYDPKYAVFYSISNIKNGLRMLKLGREIIYRAYEMLARNFQTIDNFQTLSPIHGFRSWYENNNNSLDKMQACYDYLTNECLQPKFKDPVCLFHRGNGAILDRIIPDANPKFWSQSFGIMASYKYELNKLSERRTIFQEQRKANMKRLSKL